MGRRGRGRGRRWGVRGEGARAGRARDGEGRLEVEVEGEGEGADGQLGRRGGRADAGGLRSEGGRSVYLPSSAVPFCRAVSSCSFPPSSSRHPSFAIHTLSARCRPLCSTCARNAAVKKLLATSSRKEGKENSVVLLLASSIYRSTARLPRPAPLSLAARRGTRPLPPLPRPPPRLGAALGPLARPRRARTCRHPLAAPPSLAGAQAQARASRPPLLAARARARVVRRRADADEWRTVRSFEAARLARLGVLPSALAHDAEEELEGGKGAEDLRAGGRDEEGEGQGQERSEGGEEGREEGGRAHEVLDGCVRPGVADEEEVVERLEEDDLCLRKASAVNRAESSREEEERRDDARAP